MRASVWSTSGLVILRTILDYIFIKSLPAEVVKHRDVSLCFRILSPFLYLHRLILIISLPLFAPFLSFCLFSSLFNLISSFYDQLSMLIFHLKYPLLLLIMLLLLDFYLLIPNIFLSFCLLVPLALQLVPSLFVLLISLQLGF